MLLQDAFFQKCIHIGRTFLGRKIFPPIQKPVKTDLFYHPRISCKQIRHRNRPRFVMGRGDQGIVNGAGICDGYNRNKNAVFFARCLVKFIDHRIERRFGLTSIDVPHG